MSHRAIRSAALALVLLLVPAGAFAQGGLEVGVGSEISCGVVTFSVDVQGGAGPFTLDWAFGDGSVAQETGLAVFPHETSHSYPAPGEYRWSLAVTDAEGLAGMAEGAVTLAGPAVTLSSEPFPPLLSLADGQATVQFTAQVTGAEPLTYAWDLDGDGLTDAGADTASSSASFIYTAAGKYQATVAVTDGCGFEGSDTLTVVVLDPEAEVCHPMAQRIADAVNTLFPNQAELLYTCEDIFDIFTGGLTGSQVGFGRLWHAYKLSQTIQDLTWEEIRDWHLDGNGWGKLVQLDRFATAMADVSVGDLMDMVLSGEASLKDLRTAARNVARDGGDFHEILARLTEGASPGDLQLREQRLQQHQEQATQRQQEREERASQRERERQARTAQREQERAARAAQREQQRSQEREAERHQSQDQRAAERLAEQYGVSTLQVMDLYDGVCAGDWSCVRAQLRGSTGGRPEGKGKDK